MEEKTALIIVDHGSKVAAANEMLEGIVELIRSKAPDYIIVEAAHMELAEPTIEQTIDKCVKAGATKVTVHPYMLSPGRHATQDIPRLACEAVSKYENITLEVTEPLGIHPKLAEVVLERSGLLTIDMF
jgi:sirohydrochlorin ferrochelatase